MLFSVIYTVDCPSHISIRRFLPSQRSLFQQTEGDERYEYSYLGDEWEVGKHRQLCALLTREQFDRFVSDTCLYAEDVQTMGSFGAPGLGFGVAPAISFRSDDPDAILGAYVTPIPELRWHTGHELRGSENDWERIRRAVINTYR